MSIFVSIAAYRDPELVPTIEDCLAKARNPEALRFAICWQHGPEETTLPFARDPRFHILDVDWRESRGACWARAEIMRLWDGEDWFLQLDSHHRFVEDWDVKALAQAERTGSARPILTTYGAPFTPGDPTSFGAEPLQMNFDRFTPDGITLFSPGRMPAATLGRQPVRARFLSAHFLFAPGRFVEDVPYDPDLYFIGEEITLSVRAFTQGYDFFHPSEIIVWHEYTRAHRPHKHWSDHEKSRVPVPWYERDGASLEKVRRFLMAPWVGPDGCGTRRTFAEYETFAGLSFRHRRAQDYTRRFLPPPNPPGPPDWAERVAAYHLQIELERAQLDAEAQQAKFWYVGFHDADGAEVFREDLPGDEVAALTAGDAPHLALRRAFETEREPATWTVWPYSEAGRWLDKIVGPVILRERPATFVTALVDIDRGAPGSGRSSRDCDLPWLQGVLSIDAPMIVYIEPEREDCVWRHRKRHNTRVAPMRRAALEAFAHQKVRLVRDAASENPFRTRCVFWIDAGLCRTVNEAFVRDGALVARLGETARDLVFVASPCRNPIEVHELASGALAEFYGAPVERVVRGGFFGGRPDAILAMAALYELSLRQILEAGHSATEECVLTALASRYPHLVAPCVIGESGLLEEFFAALRRRPIGRVDRLGATARPGRRPNRSLASTASTSSG